MSVHETGAKTRRIAAASHSEIVAASATLDGHVHALSFFGTVALSIP